jgi:hypothetical protein
MMHVVLPIVDSKRRPRKATAGHGNSDGRSRGRTRLAKSLLGVAVRARMEGRIRTYSTAFTAQEGLDREAPQSKGKPARPELFWSREELIRCIKRKTSKKVLPNSDSATRQRCATTTTPESRPLFPITLLPPPFLLSPEGAQQPVDQCLVSSVLDAPCYFQPRRR